MKQQGQWQQHKEMSLQAVVMETTTRTATSRMGNNHNRGAVVEAMVVDDSMVMVEVKGIAVDDTTTTRLKEENLCNRNQCNM